MEVEEAVEQSSDLSSSLGPSSLFPEPICRTIAAASQTQQDLAKGRAPAGPKADTPEAASKLGIRPSAPERSAAWISCTGGSRLTSPTQSGVRHLLAISKKQNAEGGRRALSDQTELKF